MTTTGWVELTPVWEVITHQHLIARPMVQELAWDQQWYITPYIAPVTGTVGGAAE